MDKKTLKFLLQELYLEQEEQLKTSYERSLSFQDGLFDRWERAERLNFAKGASIYNSALVFGDVQVGEQTWIGPFVLLDGSGGGIKIGSYCSISAGVHIYTHDTVMWALSAGKIKAQQAAVTIADNTYIGAQTIIKAGVTIGSKCVIGANSFINQSFEDYSIVVGSPAKVIGKVVETNETITLEYFK